MAAEDETLEAESYEHYWWDCPACAGVNDAGDIQPSNETLECDDCKAQVVVS